MLHDELKSLGFKDLSYLLNPGIYVLVFRGEVAYVGKTTNIFGRTYQHGESHRGADYVEFDNVYFIKCKLDEMDRLEALMISRLKPDRGKAWNFHQEQSQKYTGSDNGIGAIVNDFLAEHLGLKKREEPKPEPTPTLTFRRRF